MNCSYSNVKVLIDKIDKLDHTYHSDIFNILQKYGLNYSKNVNGFFFDFQNLDDKILTELTSYVHTIENNAKLTDNINLSNTLNNDDVDDDIAKACSQKTNVNGTLYDESLAILTSISSDSGTILKITNVLEKEKTLTKRSLTNKFTLSKKKYSKMVIYDVKYNIHDLLTRDDSI